MNRVRKRTDSWDGEDWYSDVYSDWESDYL